MIKNSGYNLRFSLLFGGHLCIIKQRFLERSIERNRNMSASVRSMTGYGRGEHIAEERKFTVEMKSVNHRYNDMTIKLPRSLAVDSDGIYAFISTYEYRSIIAVNVATAIVKYTTIV